MDRNFVNLVGRLTDDPKLMEMPRNGVKVSFSMATNTEFLDSETGEARQDSQYHLIIAYGKTAQILFDNFRKGQQVDVTGTIKTRRYEKDGERHRVTEIEVRRVNFEKNIILLNGNLTQEPKAGQTSTGPAANFDLAVNSGKPVKADGTTAPAQFFRCVAFGNLARYILDHAHKGTHLEASGRGQTRKWQDADRKDRYTFEVVLDQVTLIRGQGEAAGGNQTRHDSSIDSAHADSTDALEEVNPLL